MAQKSQHQESHQRETIHDKFAIFAKLVRQKKNQFGEQCRPMCMYVSEICSEGILCLFPGD